MRANVPKRHPRDPDRVQGGVSFCRTTLCNLRANNYFTFITTTAAGIKMLNVTSRNRHVFIVIATGAGVSPIFIAA